MDAARSPKGNLHERGHAAVTERFIAEGVEVRLGDVSFPPARRRSGSQW